MAERYKPYRTQLLWLGLSVGSLIVVSELDHLANQQLNRNTEAVCVENQAYISQMERWSENQACINQLEINNKDLNSAITSLEVYSVLGIVASGIGLALKRLEI